VKNTFTPDDVVDTVPLVKFTNVVDLTNTDRQEFQAFIDYSTRLGTLPESVDVTKYLHRF
jgi:NitT/TauT family transport system substrate-binding protein